MTPDQVRVQIAKEYSVLKSRADKGEIRTACIYTIIESRCREGARHNGVPGYWREYLPDQLLEHE